MYKRQGYAREIRELRKKRSQLTEDIEEIVLEIEVKQPEPEEEVQQPDEEPEVIPQETQQEVSPVSYTHLDVYKRQNIEGDELNVSKALIEGTEQVESNN